MFSPPAGRQVVDTKGGSSLKTALKTKRRRKSRPSHHSRAEKHLKTLSKLHTAPANQNTFRTLKLKPSLPPLVKMCFPPPPDSDAHSSSSTSPPPSPSYSNQSDEGSDTEARPGHAHSPAFTFLDLTYWKR